MINRSPNGAGALFESRLTGLERINQGKVRDIYAVDDQRLLIVTSDRLSAFDVVLPDPIPSKGDVLTDISNFWFGRTTQIIPNHLLDVPLEQIVPDREERESIAGRSIVVRRVTPLPIEAVVRGYLIGSGWKDYKQTGSVCGIELPPGLVLAEKLPHALYTPARKAAAGEHDENISYEDTVDMIGPEMAARLKETALALYRFGAEYARARDIIIADTKFEFGLDDTGRLILIDEILTPDSSRFWPFESYEPGSSPPSFDKQFVRDYLETLDWDKRPPGPRLPAEVIAKTSEKYCKARELLTA